MKNYLCVPGAWHGAWSWAPVAQRLRAAGHHAITLTMPGLGDGDDPRGHRLRDAVDHIVRVVEERDLTDVVLLCHSWGGYPVFGAAGRLGDRLAEIVYYNAHTAVAGKSMIDNDPPESAAFLRGLIEQSSVRAIEPSLDFVTQIFMPGAAPELQRLVADLLTPMPGGYFLDPAEGTDPATLGVSLRYLLGEDDDALPHPGAEFAARVGLTPIIVAGGHEGMLTHPDEIAKAILA
ncbi:alpha/beta fold hydrolase [Actinoplanes solisilvae]|uniref:alpha/beta fold hydrolase n=1 Tax=Actinoplanes solisilvae TaxID=2486853 RepID=UPI000FD84C3E|nr:alpha/beta hydrolase [Actinoplanes solisilvae]